MHVVPDSKDHGANMGSIWGQQDPGGPHVGPTNFAISGSSYLVPVIIYPYTPGLLIGSSLIMWLQLSKSQTSNPIYGW